MQRGLHAPHFLAEEFPFQQFHACGKQIVIACGDTSPCGESASIIFGNCSPVNWKLYWYPRQVFVQDRTPICAERRFQLLATNRLIALLILSQVERMAPKPPLCSFSSSPECRPAPQPNLK